MAAEDAHPGRTHLLVGALAGFGLGTLLAVASWVLHRRNRGRQPHPRNSGAQLRQVALMGAHAAVVLVLVGYTTTTYLGADEDVSLALGESVTVGGETVTFVGTRVVEEGPFVDAFHPRFHVEGAGTGEGTLYWEKQTGSHYPLPATVRDWDGDTYLAVDGLCIQGNCTAASDFLRAYEPGSRVRADAAEPTQVQVQLSTLPGLGLVWAALFLFVYWMGLLMATPEPGGQHLSRRTATREP